jgi:hypothetical protein
MRQALKDFYRMVTSAPLSESKATRASGAWMKKEWGENNPPPIPSVYGFTFVLNTVSPLTYSKMVADLIG